MALAQAVRIEVGRQLRSVGQFLDQEMARMKAGINMGQGLGLVLLRVAIAKGLVTYDEAFQYLSEFAMMKDPNDVEQIKHFLYGRTEEIEFFEHEEKTNADGPQTEPGSPVEDESPHPQARPDVQPTDGPDERGSENDVQRPEAPDVPEVRAGDEGDVEGQA